MSLRAGAAAVDMTPRDSQFLHGYPHVSRYSTGVHDPLISSALYLSDGRTAAIFVANDIVFVPRDMAHRARARISQAAGVPPASIMLTATHTHSGPITVDYLSSEADPVVPKADAKYGAFFEDCIVQAATQAVAAAAPARAALAVADATGVGTNRRDPKGPADMQAPVLLVQTHDGKRHIAAMVVCCMHPTVLHEDSTLVSGDFPGMCRQYLQRQVLGGDCPVLHHTGPAGNQSPRHVVRATTFAEAKRLGEILGRAVERVIAPMQFRSDLAVTCRQAFIDLPRRPFPSVEQARVRLDEVRRRLDHLRQSGADRAVVRTAECDWFGAEETLTLARAAADGRLARTCDACMPAEVQVIRVGPWAFAGWAGEVFVEYDLAAKRQCPDTFIISLANGELQGYIVTPEASAEGGYEASNAVFSPASGELMVEQTVKMIRESW